MNSSLAWLHQFTLEGMFDPKKPSLTSPLYISACIGWYFAHMLKALTPHHFTKRGGCGSINILTPPLFIVVPVPIQKREQSCMCVLGYRFCIFLRFFLFDFGIVPSVWYLFVFHLISLGYLSVNLISWIFVCKSYLLGICL